MKKAVWALAVLSCAACGEVKEVAQKIQSWADSGVLEQRHEKCQEQAGTWVARITLSACTDGSTQVEIQTDEDGSSTTVDLACLTGTGGEYAWECMYNDGEGRPYWNDGPSSPSIAQAVSGYFGDTVNQLNWNELFWDGAVNHDYCYHSGVSRDLTKDDCDSEFQADMNHVCTLPQTAPWFSADKCNLMADAMYQAVHTQGDSYYAMAGTVVDYPQWQAPPDPPSTGS